MQSAMTHKTTRASISSDASRDGLTSLPDSPSRGSFDASIAASIVDSTRLVAVTGTAGSGKSSTAMRFVLGLSAAGKTVFRLAPDAPSHVRRIRNAVTATKPDALFIDDADRFGENLPALIEELREDVPDVLIVCALRSARYESTGLSRLVEQQSSWAIEAVAPPLADEDIDGILDARAGAFAWANSKANRLQSSVAC